MQVDLHIPLNRVEGDLELEVKIEDGVVIEAKSIGTMYRGFENILKGHDPLDALVITPRVCGICSISHLMASVLAIENAFDVYVPLQAHRLRNISLMAETIQSDIRQFVFMYMSDFSDPHYKASPFFKHAYERYRPLHGKAMGPALAASRDILKVIATIGGQWPHTSHMVPGGISTIPSMLDLSIAQDHIQNCIGWFEQNCLGISLEKFLSTTSFDQLTIKEGCLQDFIDFSFAVGLEEIGKSYQNFLSYGSFEFEEGQLFQGGVYSNGIYAPFDEQKIKEDTTYAKMKVSYLHPFEEETSLEIERGYSFAKAPRYEDMVIQTGPLALLLINKEPLILDLYHRYQDSAFVREFARIYRAALYLQMINEEMQQVLKNFGESTYQKPSLGDFGKGRGLCEAARGALGHWITIESGKIKGYQIISPTTWNGSPKDHLNQRGAWEEALVGLRIEDIEAPVEIGHVVRSFDPCLVCTVHAIDTQMRHKWQLKS